MSSLAIIRAYRVTTYSHFPRHKIVYRFQAFERSLKQTEAFVEAGYFFDRAIFIALTSFSRVITRTAARERIPTLVQTFHEYISRSESTLFNLMHRKIDQA